MALKAKEYLQQVKKLNSMIHNKVREKEQWKSAAYGITSSTEGERVQSTKNPHKMADAVVNYVDIEREIEKRIIELQQKKQEIIETIEQLPEAEYDLLHKVYIQGLTLAEAAWEKEKGYSWATTIHGTALKRVQEILNEREREQ